MEVFKDIDVLKHAKFEVTGEDLLTLINTISNDLIKAEKEKPKEDPIITSDQAGEILGVTRVTLHDWSVKGILPKRKIGRRAFYYMSDIHKVLRKGN